jgi:flagellar hook-associated protein 3 FlgL
MRVPTNHLSGALVSQLQKLTSQQSVLQKQVATGQRIANPSDDPAAIARVLRLQGERREIQQFARNNDRALNVSQSSFAAIEQMKHQSDRAGEIAVLGTGTTSPDAYRAYAAEMDQMIEQALQTVNTKYGGEHLFGGTKSNTAPFTATRDVNGKITSITYTGAASGAEIRISEGAKIPPFTSGAENQKFADFVNNLVGLRDALSSGSGGAVQVVRPALETSENDFLVTLSGIGAKQGRLEADRMQNEARFGELEKLTSAETDVDLPSAVVKLTQAQTAYQAAMESGAKILSMSLLDYLR